MVFSLKKILKYFLYTVTGTAMLITGLLVYLVWLQPAFYFPKPTGPYTVGTKTYHWIDTNRKEKLHADHAHPYRELMVKIWFPSSTTLPEKPNTPYAPYLVDYLKKNKPLLWFLGYLRPTYTYAQPNVPIAQSSTPFPVILFSPGFRGFQDANTVQCEELASHGYVVVGITHPYDNTIVKFPDGRIADGLKSLAQRSQGQLLEKSTVIDDSAQIWLTDTQFVLNQIEQLARNKNSFLYQRLDLNHIGMFGHSMGGSTALQTAAQDCRLKAVVNLDGSLFGYDIPKTIGKPCMVLLAKNGVIFNERPLTPKEWKRYDISSRDEEKELKESYLPALDQLARSAQHDFYTFVIGDAGHLDLSDATLLKSSSQLVYLIATLNSSLLRMGSINGLRSTEIVNAYLLAFFNKYLKGQQSELLDGKDRKYTEVETRHIKQEKHTLLIQALSDSPVITTAIDELTPKINSIIKKELGLDPAYDFAFFIPKKLQRITLYYFNDITSTGDSLLLSALDNMRLMSIKPKHVSGSAEVNFFGDHQDELVMMINDPDKELSSLNQKIKGMAHQLNERYKTQNKHDLYNIAKSERYPFTPHMGIGRMRSQSIKNHIKDASEIKNVFERLRTKIINITHETLKKIFSENNPHLTFNKIGTLDLKKQMYVKEW